MDNNDRLNHLEQVHRLLSDKVSRLTQENSDLHEQIAQLQRLLAKPSSESTEAADGNFRDLNISGLVKVRDLNGNIRSYYSGNYDPPGGNISISGDGGNVVSLRVDASGAYILFQRNFVVVHKIGPFALPEVPSELRSVAAKDAIETTRTWYGRFLTESELSRLNLDFLTQEFIDKTLRTEQSKNEELAKCESKSAAAEVTYCYWGHHHWVEQIGSGRYRHHWQNSNTSNGCDREDQKCWGTNAWTATNVGSQTSGGGCPANSQSGYSWWGGEAV